MVRSPVHEVLRADGLPDVVATGAKLVSLFQDWQQELGRNLDLYAGSDSVFIGQIKSGEIYNQSPQECCIKLAKNIFVLTETAHCRYNLVSMTLKDVLLRQ